MHDQSDQHDATIHLTRAQSRELDRLAIEELGIPGVVLMENAGIGASDIVAGMVQSRVCSGDIGQVTIICGGGNNGGDGYVMARHLSIAGHRVALFATVDPASLQGDAAINAAVCERTGLVPQLVLDEAQLLDCVASWGQADVIVDAILGTGFSGDQVRPHTAAVIDAMNTASAGSTASGPLVLAVDVPSGLDCDTGRAADSVIRADATVTFAASKVGFAEAGAIAVLGEVFVVSIGTPPGLVERVAGAS